VLLDVDVEVDVEFEVDVEVDGVLLAEVEEAGVVVDVDADVLAESDGALALVLAVAAGDDVVAFWLAADAAVELAETTPCADASALAPVGVSPEPPPQAARIRVMTRSEGKVKFFK
jgi:hypothetical protein